jgi:hypothetical protein
MSSKMHIKFDGDKLTCAGCGKDMGDPVEYGTHSFFDIVICPACIADTPDGGMALMKALIEEFYCDGDGRLDTAQLEIH